MFDNIVKICGALTNTLLPLIGIRIALDYIRSVLFRD